MKMNYLLQDVNDFLFELKLRHQVRKCLKGLFCNQTLKIILLNES